MKIISLVVLPFLTASTLFAQTEPAPGPIVLKAARIFAATSDKLISNGAIIIEGKKILAVGTNLTLPPNAQVIDLGDATLLPGFIDAHTHLSHEASNNWYQDFFNSIMRAPAEQAHYAAANARRTLEAGFTTVRDVGSGEYLDVGLRNAINAGIVDGPRMLVAVHGVGVTGGHADSEAIPSDRFREPGIREGVCNGAEACRAAVRYQIKFGADVIKTVPSGGVLSLSDPVDKPQLTQDEINAIADEAHTWGRKVAAHSHGDVAAKMAIRAGVDSIEHGSFLQPETLQMMRDKNVYLVPTLLAGDWIMAKIDTFPPSIAEKARAAVAARSQMFRNAVRIGVKIAFGTDSGVSTHGLNAREFALMTGLGMTPAGALRSATSVASELLGLSDRIGTLERGKLADIIAVPGNPLDDIKRTERVIFVMKEGKIVKK